MKKLHPNSDIVPMNYFDFSHVKIGISSYGKLNVVDFGGENKLIIKIMFPLHNMFHSFLM